MGSIVNLRQSTAKWRHGVSPGASPGNIVKLRRTAERRHGSPDVAEARWALASPRPGPRRDGNAVFAHPRRPDWGGLQRGFAIFAISGWSGHCRSSGAVLPCARDVWGSISERRLGCCSACHARIALRLLMAAAAINLLDAAVELAGLHGNWLAMRFALGFSLGASGALLIASSVDQSQSVPPLRGSD